MVDGAADGTITATMVDSDSDSALVTDPASRPTRPAWKRWRAPVGGLLFIAIVLVEVWALSPPPSPLALTYVGSDPTSVAFIQWFHGGNQTTGFVLVDSISGSAPKEVPKIKTYDLTAVIKQGHLTLTINGHRATATLQGSTLTIGAAPALANSTDTVFRPGSMATFDKVSLSLDNAMLRANHAASH